MSVRVKSVDLLLVVCPTASLNDAKITIASFKAQLLPGANLRIGFSIELADEVRQFLASEADGCDNISLHSLEKFERIKLLNSLVDSTSASYFAILDAGDALAHGAVMHIYNALEEHNFSVDVLYSDEDKQGNSDLYTNAYFKPEWSPELLQSFNYFGRLTVLNTCLVKELGLFDSTLEDASEWDLNLRISEVSHSIYRICRVLCHRVSTSCQERPTPGSKDAKFREAAIEKFWRNRGVIPYAQTQANGTQHVIWDIVDEPKVSIIIPTKNKLNLIQTCLNGLLTKTAYQNFEIIIVDTGSTDVEVLAFYETLQEHPNIQLVLFQKPFNYSAACNFGASYASGKFLLFLNNDIEVLHTSWLSEMVRCAIQPGVGMVGPELIYPSGDIQSAGIFLGPYLVGTAYLGAKREHWGVLGSPEHPRNYLSVSGACQLITQEAFHRVSGFDEGYLLSHSDIALSLNIWLAGYRIVYNPYASIIHYVGVTRGFTNPEIDSTRFADEVYKLGFNYDPYFHPELNAQITIPQVRREYEWRDRESLAHNIAYFGGPQIADTIPFHLLNLGSVLQATGLDRVQVLWSPQAVHEIDDRWSAARFCIDFLRSRDDIRQRFPTALSDQAGGAFYHYLLSAEADLLGLTPVAQLHIRDLFEVDISINVQKSYLLDTSLRQQFPLGLLPTRSAEFITWLLVHGAKQLQLRNEEIWWFALKWHETPEAAMMLTFQTTPEWQLQCPNGLTVFGAEDLAKWLTDKFGLDACWAEPKKWPLSMRDVDQIRQTYGCNLQWQTEFPHALKSYDDALLLMHWLRSVSYPATPLVKAWLARVNPEQVAHELAQLGVNVLAPFCYPSGLRTSAESICDGLERNGVLVAKSDLPTDKTDEPGHADMRGSEVFDISILHVQPEPFFNNAYVRADIAERAKKTYRIAYWYWELDVIPQDWIQSAELADELWAATEFIASAMRRSINKPIQTMFPGVRLKEYKSRSLAEFGVKQTSKFSFLFVFSMMSVMGRKNPIGLINAFKATFSNNEEVQLIIKTSYGYRNPVMLNRLREAAQDANIMIIDDVYTDDMTLSLMNACDAYISLHRSEGLGLTMAEAMMLGKPVIATRYSGNLDFMDDSNSLLVDYNLTEVGSECLPYMADAYWANPSEVHAGQHMRYVFEHQAWAKQLGQKAQQDLQERFSSQAAGKAMQIRLQSITQEYNSRADSI